MKRKVYIIDDIHPILIEELTSLGFECQDLSKLNAQETESIIVDAYGIIVRSKLRFNKETIDKLKQLSFIARAGSGLENIDIEYCTIRGIHVFNSPEGNSNAVAEHLLGMVLSLFNNVVRVQQELKTGLWQRKQNTGIEINEKTVGILGYGNNGAAFASKLAALGAKVMVFDKYKSVQPEQNILPATIKEIQQEADILSLHLPLNDETKNLVNNSFLYEFRKSIYFLNISRGELVNTKDLVNALKNKKILGACLDVLEYENTRFNVSFSTKNTELEYLLNADNVILTPHIAGLTKESFYLLSKVLVDKIKKERLICKPL